MARLQRRSRCQTERMDDVDAYNFALLLLRCGVGAVMLAHGINHIRPTIDGTAGWFASMGMKPGKLHAWLASLTEIGCGILLILGLLTPFAAAGIVGVMAVAWMINHRGNGFFIFRPGEGWEYVMTLGIVGHRDRGARARRMVARPPVRRHRRPVGDHRAAHRRRRRDRRRDRLAGRVLATAGEGAGELTRDARRLRRLGRFRLGRPAR